MKYFLVVSLILIHFISIESFAQDDDKNEKVVIEFNFNNPDSAFKKKLPFDEPFTILFFNIPTTTTSLKLKLYKYPANEKKPGDSVLQIEPVKWERKNSTQTSAKFNIPRLKPNADYRFELEDSAERPLTSNEKTTIANNLLVDVNLQNSINLIASTYIDSFFKRPGIISYNPLTKHSEEVLNNIERGIKATDVTYKLGNVDLENTLDKVSTFTDELLNIANKIDQFDSLKGVSSDFKKANNDFKIKFKTTNWAFLTSGDPEYADLNEAIDNILTSFAVPLQPSDSSALSTMKTALDNAIVVKDALKNDVINKVVLPYVYSHTGINTTYRADFVKHSKLYITLDVGLAYVSRMDRLLTYSGVNIYFRPVNKAIPLSHFSGWDWWAVRTSLLIGITLESIEKENIRKGLIDNKALLVGLGFRIVPFLKINGGTLVHYRYDKNPLLTNKRYYTSLSPFFSFSLDVDIKTLFSGVGNSIFK